MCAMKYPQHGQPPFTYADYLQWPDDQRWEIIEGVPYNMTPAPTRIHQQVSMALSNQLYNFLKGKPCEVYAAPFDVRLTEASDKTFDKEITSVVQPDITVVCDPNKLDERGCLGTPEFIIEIISPSTAAHDYIRKLHLYEKHGVQEYWIVHPIDQIVMVHLLDKNNKAYGKAIIYSAQDQIDVRSLPDLTIDLETIFNSLNTPDQA